MAENQSAAEGQDEAPASTSESLPPPSREAPEAEVASAESASASASEAPPADAVPEIAGKLETLEKLETNAPHFPVPEPLTSAAPEEESESRETKPAPAMLADSAPIEAEPTQPDATPLGLDVSGDEPMPASTRERENDNEMEEVFYNSFRPPSMSTPELDEDHQRQSIRFSAEAKARRTHLAKYVKATLGVSGAIVLVAVLVRVASPTLHAEPSRGSEIVAASPATEPAKPIAAATASAAPSAAAAIAAPAASASATASAMTAASAAPAAAAASAAPVGGDEAHERAAAQAALDKGKLADAIAAGERAVAIDPTDGDAWLVLGAAYQEHGDMVNARRCYKSCIDDGKRGAIRECRAMVGR